MRILISSVYNENSLKWLEIQSEFIKNNTSSDFDLVLFFQGSMHGFVSLDCESTSPQDQHVFGIKKIFEEFVRNESFTHCLILDSDAFPVMKNWDVKMEADMHLNDCGAACPIRFENLDTFLHPCVIFYDRKSLSIEVELKKTTNLLGYSCEEVVVSPPGKTFPLLRTNVFSPHPISSSIYYDMFYHHGFGSRDFLCRSIHVNGYYEDLDPSLLTRQIMSGPKSFIAKLMGKKIHD